MFRMILLPHRLLLFQYRGLIIKVTETPLSPDDRLYGYEWRGRIEASTQFSRDYNKTANSGAWVRWQA
jgi:hypothetical protein